MLAWLYNLHIEHTIFYIPLIECVGVIISFDDISIIVNLWHYVDICSYWGFDFYLGNSTTVMLVKRYSVEFIYKKVWNRNHPELNWYLPPPRVLALAATKASSTDWIILMIFSYEYFFDWDNLILMLLFIWTIVYLQTGVTHFTTKNRVSTTHLSYAHSKFRRSDFEVRQKLWSEAE